MPCKPVCLARGSVVEEAFTAKLLVGISLTHMVNHQPDIEIEKLAEWASYLILAGPALWLAALWWIN